MQEYLINLLIAVLAMFVATLGYCLIYNVPLRVLSSCATSAIAGWITYYSISKANGNTVAAAFAAAMVIALISEILARVVRTPASIILIIGVLPLVPGSQIYFTIEALMNGQYQRSISVGIETVGIAFALAMGILIVSTFVQLFFMFKNRWKKYKAKRSE